MFFNFALTFGQKPNSKDFIEKPIYDTINIEIESTNSFYFCSKLYAIPRNCNIVDQSNCCSYNSHISKWQKGEPNGQLSCDDGTSLFWINFDNLELAKRNFENTLIQQKGQMKEFKQDKVKFFVCDKEVPAYKLSLTTLEGYKFCKFTFYGTINGHSILGELFSDCKVGSSNDLSDVFQQIVRF